MDRIKTFLELNLNTVTSSIYDQNIKEGINPYCLFDDDNDSFLDARISYLRNLCLKIPIKFYVPENLPRVQRALMFLSFNDLEGALSSLNGNFNCEVTGASAKMANGSKINILVVQTSNNSNNIFYKYKAQDFECEVFVVQPLNFEEMIFLYIKMMDIFINNDSQDLKKPLVQAYLNRLNFIENESSLSLKRSISMIDSILNNSTKELEELLTQEININEDLFNHPIILKGQMMIQLGSAYKNTFYYDAAYNLLKGFPVYLEKIECLISLRRSQEAVLEINAYIDLLKDSYERGDRIILADLYIKLAHLYNDPSYFDKSGDVFRSSKPFYLKGLFYFKKQEYEDAIIALRIATSITPSDENIRFTYGCTLIEVDRISEAIAVFSRLRQEDPTNDKITKNLSYCYFKMEDIEQSLTSLESLSLMDPGSLNQYLFMALKNTKMDKVKWALTKIRSLEILKGGIAYILTNNLIDLCEVQEIVSNNPHVDRSAFDVLFSF